MADAIVYFALIRFGLAPVAAGALAFNLMYYGPKGLGGPLSGLMFAGLLL